MSTHDAPFASRRSTTAPLARPAGAPKANMIDVGMKVELAELFERAAAEPGAEGDHDRGRGTPLLLRRQRGRAPARARQPRCSGASTIFRAMAAAAVRSSPRCAGSAWAAGWSSSPSAHRVFAAPDAKLGQPEILLGVFAPVASVILPSGSVAAPPRISASAAGSLGAEEALRIGLVDEIADDPRAAALAYARKYLLPHSASSLRLAVRAVRLGFDRTLREDLGGVESLYLEDLMAPQDAVEGIRAFLEKREPVVEQRMSRPSIGHWSQRAEAPLPGLQLRLR